MSTPTVHSDTAPKRTSRASSKRSRSRRRRTGASAAGRRQKRASAAGGRRGGATAIGAPPPLDQFSQRLGEPAVVLRGPDCYTQRSLAPERGARAHEHPPLREALHHRGLVGVLRKAYPDEVCVRLGDPQTQVSDLLFEPES